jgi:hypothetical protein
MTRLRPLLATCVLAAVGCREGRPSLTTGMVVRDSDGVHIVLNTAPAWRRDSAWTVVDTPFFDVADRAGRPFQEIVSLIRTPAGVLAVADAGDERITVLNGIGEVVRILGARGTAPGEFRSLDWLVSAGDSLMAYDRIERRLTMFGTVGKVRTASLDLGGLLATTPLGRFRDGSLLVESGGPIFPFPGRPWQVRRDSAELVRVDADGRLLDTLALVPWSESFGVELGSGDRRFVAPMPRPFARRTSAAPLVSGFVLGEGGTYAVDVYDLQGVKRLSMRRNLTGAPVTPEAIEAFRDARRSLPVSQGLQGSLDSAMTAALDSAPFPQAMPVYERLLVDDPGNIWVENYSIRSDQPRIWSVFNTSGRWLGDVATPPGFRMFYIAKDALYGVWYDANGTPHVQGYALTKPQ